jgi:hypothetical protein
MAIVDNLPEKVVTDLCSSHDLVLDHSVRIHFAEHHAGTLTTDEN